MVLVKNIRYLVTSSGPRELVPAEVHPVATRSYCVVDSGIVKVTYGKGCLILVPGDVFAVDDATVVAPAKGLLVEQEAVTVRAIDPTTEQLKVFADKCIDKLEMLTADVDLGVKIGLAESELRGKGVKPTQVMIGEYIDHSREWVGRCKKRH